MAQRTRTALTAVAAVFPELAVGLAVWQAWHARVRGDDPERGDAIQWVILTAVGAAIAIYDKRVSLAESSVFNRLGTVHLNDIQVADGEQVGVVVGVALIATMIVGQIAVRPERRFAPTLARWADLLELAAVMATVPLALLMLGTFGYFRSLGG